MPDTNTAGLRPPASPLYLHDEALKQGVDLVFAAFSELFSEQDPHLRAAGLGRAHRRALYFIARRPGVTVADLLKTLKIRKQSLARVVNDLLAGGYIERRQAVTDRRMRQLRLTEKGSDLEARLWEAQRPRLVRAFRAAGPENVAGFRRTLSALVEGEGEATP